MKNATHISADGITYGLYYFSCLLDGKHTMNCAAASFLYAHPMNFSCMM